ncbi:MAG: hypothetical protein KF718_00240 [Polyangiaceae bacterium]|nr:hypothetical protein [Polyangiaceae bacterium]
MRRAVKSPHLLRAGLTMLALCFGASVATVARAQKLREPGVLTGGGPSTPRDPRVTDPWLPTGAEIGAIPDRPGSRHRACSTHRPVCVHFDEAGRSQAPAALIALETAWSQLVLVLGLPAPLPDQGRGGTDALDAYLEPSGDSVHVQHEGPDTSRFDRASGFCTLGVRSAATIARVATLCVAEAIALRLDPAATPHIRRAYANHLWWIVGTPTHQDLEAIDDLQSNPQLGIATRDRSAYSDASALWFEYLDRTLGRDSPGALATAMLAQSVAKTPPTSLSWDNEPDVFDVLRSSFDGKHRRIAELFTAMAVARAFLGARDDGTYWPELAHTGDFGRVRFDWTFGYSTLPRRVALRRPLEPTGSVYVWLTLDKVPEAATLGFQAEWEAPATFAWSLVRIDQDGREAGRINAPFVERGQKVEQNLVGLEGLSAILVVGVNLGGVDLEHPFDPDVAPHEPHGCTIYLAAL